MLLAEMRRRLPQGHGGVDDSVRSLAKIRAGSLVEQPLHVVAAIGKMRSEAGMHRGAEDAAIGARRRRRGQFALGAR
jgi:ligand-binding sensor domain-containing protein